MRNFVFIRIAFSFYTLISVGTWAQDDETVLAVASDQVETYWVPIKKVAPVYPMKSIRNGEQGCVAVGYIIEPDGTTSNHRAVASFPSNNFDRASVDAAKQFLYEPAETNKDRAAIFTTNSFTFNINRNKKHDEKMQKELDALCTAAANKALKFAPAGPDA